MLPAPLLYLSAFFEATRDEYYRQLYNVSAQGTWNEWIAYFLNGIAVQSEDALSRTERINGHIEVWKIQAAGAGLPLSVEMVEYLAINPFLTIARIAKHFEVAFTTAQRSITHLESLGIITQTNDSKRDRVYCAIKILDILEEPAKIHA